MGRAGLAIIIPMTKEEKIEFLSRLWMYGAKCGYNADISQVEYFLHQVGDDLGLSTETLVTSRHVNDSGDLNASEKAVMDAFRMELFTQNP